MTPPAACTMPRPIVSMWVVCAGASRNHSFSCGIRREGRLPGSREAMMTKRLRFGGRPWARSQQQAAGAPRFIRTAARLRQHARATLSPNGGHMTTDELLRELQTSPTGLAGMIETVVRDRLPYVVIPVQAVQAWKEEEPQRWAKAARWLAAHNVALVQV